MARIFATADIGSNTAHLLVAATDGEIVMRVDNLNEWIPLGEVVARRGEIPAEEEDRLVGAMREFKRVAGSRRASRMYVFATEAMRSAANHEAVLKKIKSETGVKVELIDPQREAELSFLGMQLDNPGFKATLLFEVGGGSAQVARVDRTHIIEDLSLPLGTGRLIAEAGLTSPCSKSALEQAKQYISAALSKVELHAGQGSAIATGGVVRGLWRALHPDGEKTLARQELEYLAWATERLGIDRIIERFGVKPKRAGTLLPGALVYLALMDKFHLDVLGLSEFGVREGAILEMAKGNVKGQAV